MDRGLIVSRKIQLPWNTEVGMGVAEADVVVCPSVRSGRAFAVADACRSWPDLTDDDVTVLQRSAGSTTA